MRRLLLPLALVIACGSPAAAGGMEAARILRIACTAETRGNLMPCPCPERPLGGLARRIGLLDSLDLASSEPLLIVDAGRFLPSRAEHHLLPEQTLIDLRQLLRDGAVAAGYDAIAIDPPSDASPGLDARWLAPNRARIVQAGNLRIAVAAAHEGIDPAPCRKSIRDLGKADAVLLLCAGDLSFARAAARVAGADIAIVARGARFEAPLVHDGVLFLGPGRSGKSIALAECRIVSPGRVEPLGVRLRAMDASVRPNRAWQDRVEEAILRFESEHPMALEATE